MHLIWENLISNLVLFWTGNFKDLNHQGRGYVIETHIWMEIGAATEACHATIPAAFGASISNIAVKGSVMTAEMWANWTLHIAPVVLRGRFKKDKYYKHFLKLVKLLKLYYVTMRLEKSSYTFSFVYNFYPKSCKIHRQVTTFTGYFVSVFFVINIYTNRWNFVPPKKVVFYITTLSVTIYIIPSFFIRNFHTLGFTVQEWQHLIEGAEHQCEIWTDHKNLEYFMTAKQLNQRQA